MSETRLFTDSTASLEMFVVFARESALSTDIFATEFAPSDISETPREILGNIILVAISKKGGKVIIPKSDTVISEGDELFIIGETEQIQTITAKQGKHINETNINNVMLLGGGKTAFFLGKMLLDFGINVKIIDNNSFSAGN